MRRTFSPHPTRILAAVAAGLAAIQAAAAPTPPAWRMVETPKFKVLSQLPDDDTQAWAREFTQFVEALGEIVPSDERVLAPLTVVLFADDAGFAPFKPQGAEGKRANNVAGYFANRDAWSVIGMSSRRADGETRQTIFHEGVHWFTSDHIEERPVWFEEGLADAYSTFRLEAGEAVWGERPDNYLEFLRRETPPPLREVLRAARSDAVFADERQAALFYARSWAFVHLQLFGEPGDGGASLARFLDAVQKGADVDGAFVAAFGRSPEEMDGVLDAYLAGHGYTLAKRSLGVSRAGRVGPMVDAPEIEVESALARLALGAGFVELAQQHMTRVVELAPADPLGYELFTALAADCGDGESVLAASERAIDLGSQDAGVYFLRAQEFFRAAGEGEGLDASSVDAIAGLYRHALTLRPGLPLAYRSFGRLLCSMDEVPAGDVGLLQQGRRLFPHDGEIPFALAVLAVQRGEVDEAARLLGDVFRPGVELSDEAREAAQSLAASLAGEKIAARGQSEPRA